MSELSGDRKKLHGEQMRVWFDNTLKGQRMMTDVETTTLHIGKSQRNDVVLDHPLVADRAAIVQQTDDGWTVRAIGTNGCQVEHYDLGPGDEVHLTALKPMMVYPFAIRFEQGITESTTEAAEREVLDLQQSDLIREVHHELLELQQVETSDKSRRESVEYQFELENAIASLADRQRLGEVHKRDLVRHIAGHCVRQLIIDELIDQSGGSGDQHRPRESGWNKLRSNTNREEHELAICVEECMDVLELDQLDDLSEKVNRVDRQFWSAWREASHNMLDEFLIYVAVRDIKKQIKDIVFGYGPLEDYLRLPTVTEIMVVDRDRIFVEKNGVIENSGRRFTSDQVTLAIIDRIVSRVGRRIDKSKPIVDARLLDGSRVNAVIPPIAISGPCITIRKFPDKRIHMQDLVRWKALSEETAGFLKAAVRAKCNVLIAGGTGTGKTTLLNCLADAIPNKERIVTVEDTAELQITKEHVVRMETKPANAEGAGGYTIHDLVKNALRMRPDRVVVGECRGGEALDMLQAMNTGHDGSLTTIHANSPKDAQLRLEVMVRTAADLPVSSIHRQIAAAVDLIVQLTRGRDGVRRVTQVTEVVGVDDQYGGVRLKDLFHCQKSEGNSMLVPTGCIPSFIEKLMDVGYDLKNFYP